MRATFSDEDLAALDARVAQLPRNRAASGSQVQQDSVLGDFSSTLFVDTIYGGAKALVTGEAGRALGERGVGIVETLTNRSFTGTPSDYARLTRAFLGDLTGVNAGVEAYYGYDISNQQELSDFERLSRGVNSVTQLSGGAAGILKFRGGRVAPVRNRAAQAATQLHIDRAATIRTQLGIGKTRNIAFAEGQVGGRTIGEIVGVSGKNTPGVKIPSNRTFKTGVDGFDRAFDAEVAVFENLARKLRPGDKGTIRLFSERPFCESCSGVIQQFEQKFPGIKLVPSTGP